ncbi:hypothetical protein CDAR_57911 [Caerostris darwini]|uniref:Uncharacterized protein n=1 Tax=Caerostris darwini TaxID=1538125 RepID=A0AAV4QHW5_9ARAC|nr:hypothetical protein CDAR_57911 [Caerostris darwini]
MDTHSTATVNSAKTIFFSKNIGFPVSDKQEKPSASHPCPTRLMTVTLPPPVSRPSSEPERSNARLAKMPDTYFKLHRDEKILAVLNCSRGFTRKARPPFAIMEPRLICTVIYESPSIYGQILLMQLSETLYDRVFWKITESNSNHYAEEDSSQTNWRQNQAKREEQKPAGQSTVDSESV